MVFHLSLRDSKSPQVSRSLLCILADLNNAVVLMVSTCPLISKFSSPGINPLVTEPRAPLSIGSIVTFIFHSFFNSLVSSFFTFFEFFSVVSRDSKVLNSSSSLFSFFFFFFLLIITRPVGPAEIWCSVCISKSRRSLCMSFSRTDAGLCIYHFFVWAN